MNAMAVEIAPRIVVDTNVRFGKPVIQGTRIAVEDVLDLVAGGLSFDQILKDCYPHLSREDIEACLRYAAQVIKGEEVHVSVPPSP